MYYNSIDQQDEFFHLETGFCGHNQSEKGFLEQINVNGKWIQRVLLKNLIPGNLYCYEIKSGDVTSHVYSFRMPKEEASVKTNFVILTDNQNLDNNIESSILNNFKYNNLNSIIAMNELDTLDNELNSEIFSSLPILNSNCNLCPYVWYLRVTQLNFFKY